MSQTAKPIVPSPEMTLHQRRRCGKRFKDQTIKGLNALIKGTGWKRSSAWVFKVEGDWYLTAFVTGGTTPDGLSNSLGVELGIKPMAVDPINWRAQGLHSNLKKPPSFRSRAAFKVPALPIAKRQWSEGLTNVSEASRIVFEAINEIADDARRAVEAKPFSHLVSEHENAENYRALKWASLIAEGQGDSAIEHITTHYTAGGSADTISGVGVDIVVGYQNVVDGTDTSEYRPLVTDAFGNQKLDGPYLQPSKKNTSERPSLTNRLKTTLRGFRK